MVKTKPVKKEKPIKFELDKQAKERIPLLIIFKEQGLIKTDCSDDTNDFELYGFLKLYVERMGRALTREIRQRED